MNGDPTPLPEDNRTRGRQRRLKEFNDGVKALVNRLSIENFCDTPDYMIADYLTAQLALFADTVNSREKWHGRK